MKNTKRKWTPWPWIVLALMVVGLIAVLCIQLHRGTDAEPGYDVTGFNRQVSVNIALDTSLTVKAFGSYTGSFMEDGSDRDCSGVLGIIVSNDGKKDLRYGEFSLSTGEKTYHFLLTTLPAGATVLLLELQGAGCPQEIPGAAADMIFSYFEEPMSLRQEHLSISAETGVITVSNRADAIDTDFYIYYKNQENGIYLGGITYRVHVAAALGAGEVRKISAKHYIQDVSRLLFVA